MKEVIILRYGELHLKGNNRAVFENILCSNIKLGLKDFVFSFKKIPGRYIVSDYKPENKEEIKEKLTKIFGLISLSEATELKTDKEEILSFCRKIKINEKSFKATVNRADKTFSVNSNEFAKLAGTEIAMNNPSVKVDVVNPECEVNVDIREKGVTYISSNKTPCAGGLPIGCGGRGLALLSGGIDSPVSTYLIGKRGMAFDILHFNSYPHTSRQAEQKVFSLARKLKEYSNSFIFYNCNLAEIQESIFKNCRGDYQITILRRFMLRIAERLCEEEKLSAIITGESLGQVASQTIESITCTNNVLKTKPVLRPLIGTDKKEIIEFAKNIGTYEISIQPYEDCCTVFVPKHPVIKPTIKQCEIEEGKLDIESLIDSAIKNVEKIKF